MSNIKSALPTLLALFAFANVSLAQLANSPPVPQWIAVSEKSTLVEKSFEWSGKLLKAILFSAADGRAEIVINGKIVGSVEGREKAASLDVTRFVREGSNTIALRSNAAVAPLLDLIVDLARKQWIATDASWTA